MDKPHFSNITDTNLRLQISQKEEQLEQSESKPAKTKEEFRQLAKIKEEFNFLLRQSKMTFRLINTIWFNRFDSIFFSVKKDPSI